MELQIQRFDDALVVRLYGEIDMGVSEGLRRSIDREWERQRLRYLVLGLQEVDFIDSSGIGLLLGRYKRVIAQGGKMALVGARPAVHRILELSGMYKVMPGFAGEGEAIRMLKGGFGA
ncbi:STAS domain-containing protein [Heliophilum fasciatum]|uniref:STAS domain-containing protein n=1 Tax=Heliophilum fasciatum TaxID=35700 RepID=UPI0010539EDD|nr:anti-sigma factor antagonist [Heliophilum fasciatum]MCW2277364.1 stage II sporulation protein AA (anti-sigma F factor antagonist) [Heliophilum fasciatum]